MNHILEVFLFILLFCIDFYLFLILANFYGIVEEMISKSELKMNDKINEVKLEIIKLQKDNNKYK